METPKTYLPDKSLECLQTEVGLWHTEVFGMEPINKRIGRKLLEESAEFMVALTASRSGCVSLQSELEAGDVLICLMAWEYRNDVDLINAARCKFEIVRSRDQKARDNT